MIQKLAPYILTRQKHIMSLDMVLEFAIVQEPDARYYVR